MSGTFLLYLSHSYYCWLPWNYYNCFFFAIVAANSVWNNVCCCWVSGAAEYLSRGSNQRKRTITESVMSLASTSQICCHASEILLLICNYRSDPVARSSSRPWKAMKVAQLCQQSRWLIPRQCICSLHDHQHANLIIPSASGGLLTQSTLSSFGFSGNVKSSVIK